MPQSVVIINASRVVPDADVIAKIVSLQIQVDRDFLPAWGARATAARLSFASLRDVAHVDPAAWPIYLNKHSTDPGALGWHDAAAGKIFSRVFVGDCLRYGLDWGVTLSHELLELLLDPDVKRAWRMPDGRLAALEACDAVEDDRYGYVIQDQRVSDFVLPAYFSASHTSPFDHSDVLRAPCPELSPGGYMSVTDARGAWTQINADLADGLASVRAINRGHRRLARAGRTEIEEVQL